MSVGDVVAASTRNPAPNCLNGPENLCHKTRSPEVGQLPGWSVQCLTEVLKDTLLSWLHSADWLCSHGGAGGALTLGLV